MSEKITAIIDAIKELTIIEVNDLVSQIEEEFGVQASAMMAMAPAAGGAAAGAAEEEQTEFTVVLTGAGPNKVKAIKVIREITGLGLKDAKGLVEAAPKEVKENISKEEAEEIAEKIKETGAEVEIK